MGTKKTGGRVFIYVDERLRARLNLYKAQLGVETGVMDQNATIEALLDNVGVPAGNAAVERPAQAVQP